MSPMAARPKGASGGSSADIRLKAALDAAAAKELARVNAAAAAATIESAAQAATQATRVDYDKAYYEAMLDTAKAAPDRWRSAAELVQKSAAAIGTLYAGILGVTFSVSGHQLPVRGVVPALFLGLAIAMSTVYVAYNTLGTALKRTFPSASPPERMRARLNQFLAAVHESVERRVYWLRASVMALGMGVLFLPAPFIAFTSPSVPNLDRQYPWPSPTVVADAPTASIASIVYKARVDEVAAQRQRAEAAQDATSDLRLWVEITIVALAIVLLIPLLSLLSPIVSSQLVPRVPWLKAVVEWKRRVLNPDQPSDGWNLPFVTELRAALAVRARRIR